MLVIRVHRPGKMFSEFSLQSKVTLTPFRLPPPSTGHGSRSADRRLASDGIYCQLIFIPKVFVSTFIVTRGTRYSGWFEINELFIGLYRMFVIDHARGTGIGTPAFHQREREREREKERRYPKGYLATEGISLLLSLESREAVAI